MSDKKLTQQQELFCQQYVIDYNGTQAACRAGYSEKTAEVQASRLLRNVKVLSRVRAIQKERLEKLAVTQESVILKLLEVYDRCMQAKPVTTLAPKHVIRGRERLILMMFSQVSAEKFRETWEKVITENGIYFYPLP